MKFNESASMARIGDPCPLTPGTRIVLVTMPHDPDPIPRGTKGTVIGGNGEQIWVDWDNGRTLNLAVDKDVWAVIDNVELVENLPLTLMLDDIDKDQRHDCAFPGCQHAASYSDEAFCWYHEPPVAFMHNCKFQNCKHWSVT
jgi:hypothetical protein